jgi:DNA-directed RNA polymerase specialized sigma24 family protein
VARRERLLLRNRRAWDDTRVVVDTAPDDRQRALKAAFDGLPERLRTVSVLRLYAGLSESETAEILGCPVGTVKSSMHEARRRLSEALRYAGFAPVVVASHDNVLRGER